MWRKILLVLALFVIVLAGMGIYSIHRLDSRMAQEHGEKLQKLVPRVITGAGQFEKTPFYTGTSLGEISEILVGWPADREGATFTVVGMEGAHFLDESGALKKQILFPTRCPMEVTRLDASGDYGFLTRDQGWALGVTLLDKRGQELWTYGGRLTGIDDSASGDLLGDGRLEVVVGRNGHGGVALLDRDGKNIWQKAEANVWHVETLDIKGDGHREILHSNARGQLLVRNASGDVVADYLPDHYVSQFALTRWGAESQASHILIPSQERRDGCCKPALIVLRANGKAVADLQAPLGDLMNRARGTPVRYAKETEYYAALENAGISLERSMLFLYDKNGQIVYQEIIGDSCSAISTLPGKLGDRLVVACAGKIWEYSPAVKSIGSQRETNGGNN
jgi:hypothetical protein